MRSPAAMESKTAGRDAPAVEYLENDLSRYYISPIGGALKTKFVDNLLAFMFSCLLSKWNDIDKILSVETIHVKNGGGHESTL